MENSKVVWEDCCSEGPYHTGELQVQKKVGVEGIAERTGRIISNRIPNAALKFVDKQPMVIVSSQDEAENIWTTILVGEPGFVTAENERNIRIHLPSIVSSRVDHFWGNIKLQPKIGMLFIELATRRRLRVNGIVSRWQEDLHVAVEQAYPNCPKYIQSREIEVTRNGLQPSNSRKTGSLLGADLAEWIERADTFFVGSSDGKSNMDASHRGGKPGFVRIAGTNTLVIPDYPGNSMFNTLGNFWLNPKAGFLFVDFETGDTLQLTGKVEVVWTDDAASEETGGTMRLWKFHVTEWIRIDSLKGANWKFVNYSPFNILTENENGEDYAS